MARRRTAGDVFYERGIIMRWGYPNLTAPEATLEFLRNPLYGSPHVMKRLAQGIVTTPTGRSTASSIASGTVKTLPRKWGHMPRGFPQAQRLTGEATVQCDTPETLSLASGDVLVSIGFRTFDGVEPTRVQCIELDAVGSELAGGTHDFVFTAAALRPYPGGVLTQLDLEFTADAACAMLRIEAESAGEDFAITDLYAFGPGELDAFAHVGAENANAAPNVLDEDADGLGNAWSLAAGELANVRWHGEDAAGLEQWVESVCKGALRTFEVERDGDGVIRTCKFVKDVTAIGWPSETAGVVSGVDITLEEVAG